MNFITTTKVMNALFAVGTLAVLMRVPMAKEVILNESKFLGIF